MSVRQVARGWWRSVVAIGLFVVLVLAAPQVLAQTSTNNSGEGNNLRVSPVRTDVRISPGESRQVPIYVENLESTTVTLKPIQNDFIAGSREDGIPSIILDEDEYAPTHSLKRFMQPLEVITVGPRERKLVEVTLTVPADAQAGGYFGALRFAPSDPDGSNVVNMSGSVASLMLLTVPGNLIESLQLTDFEILTEGESMSRFLPSPENVAVMMRLENKGNVQVAPFGKFMVLKGDDMVYSVDVNDADPPGVVLPDSARRFEIPAENMETFGKYTFKATLGYGTGGQTIDIERTVWIIPWLYIILAVVGLLVIIVLTAIIVLAMKSYKRRILRGARRR